MKFESHTLYTFGFPGANPRFVYRKGKVREGAVGQCGFKGPVPKCPNWPEKHGSDYYPDVKNLYIIGKRTPQLLWNYETCLVSEGLVPAFVAAEFSGLNFRDVNLFKASNCSIREQGYVEMEITGIGEAAIQRSGMTLDYRCPLCGYERYSHWDLEKGLHFQQDINDLPDLFMMRPLATTFFFAKARFCSFLTELGVWPLEISLVKDIVLSS